MEATRAGHTCGKAPPTGLAVGEWDPIPPRRCRNAMGEQRDSDAGLEEPRSPYDRNHQPVNPRPPSPDITHHIEERHDAWFADTRQADHPTPATKKTQTNAHLLPHRDARISDPPDDGGDMTLPVPIFSWLWQTSKCTHRTQHLPPPIKPRPQTPETQPSYVTGQVPSRRDGRLAR